jgi:hypothetical protein
LHPAAAGRKDMNMTKKDDTLDRLANLVYRLNNLTDANQDEKELLIMNFVRTLDKHELKQLKDEVAALQGQHTGSVH